MNLNNLTIDEIEELLGLLEEKNLIDKRNFIDHLFPDTGPLRRELYPKIIEFFEAGSEYKFRLLTAGNRVGKALHDDELVFTPTGSKRIGDCQIGDIIIGDNGKITTVIGVYPQGERQLYKLTFNDRTSILADIDHRWSVYWSSGSSKGERKSSKIPTIKTTRELIEAQSKGIRFAVELCQPVEFQESNIQSNRYIIGALLGDGMLSQKNVIVFSTADQEMVKKFDSLGYTLRYKSKYDYGLKIRDNHTQNYYPRAKLLLDELQSLGMMQKLSHQKFIPDCLKYDSVENRTQLLQGLMDTDGYVNADGRCSYSSVSKQLAEDILWLSRSLGYKAYVDNGSPKFYTDKNGNKIQGRIVYTVYITGRDRSNLVTLKRKRDKTLLKVFATNKKVIQSIIPDIKSNATCIEVDNQSHCFLTSNFTITHNTFAAAYEVVCHATGKYPHWWKGKRFTHPQNWWVCGVDNNVLVDEAQGLQVLLLGSIGNFGTGMIPYDNIEFDSLKEITKAKTQIGTIRIKHKSGGLSSITFKSYKSGRETFQTANACIWLDEEPPEEIYTECVRRTTHVSGESPILIMTFTPLKGVSDTIKIFFEGKPLTTIGPIGVSKFVQRASFLTDAPHVSEIEKKIMVANTPQWAFDARINGIPHLGSGAIYPIPWSEISVPRFEIPKHWKRYAGMDVGNKTAVVWLAIDPSTQVHYAYYEYYREGQLPSVHVQGIAPIGQWIPIAIDHAAHGRSQIDGQNLFDMYKDLGLTLHNANKAVETGLYTCWELLANKKVKIFNDLNRFQEEYLVYQRDEKGNVVKKDDHMMDSFRYAIMTGRDLAVNEMESKSTQNNYWNMGVSAHLRPTDIITRR
jgi:phage terminase large subunit-like protein